MWVTTLAFTHGYSPRTNGKHRLANHLAMIRQAYCWRYCTGQSSRYEPENNVGSRAIFPGDTSTAFF